MKNLLPLYFLWISSLAPAMVPDEPVTIKKIMTNGSGCPFGTSTPSLVGNGRSMAILFSEFQVQLGPDIPLSESRRNCIMTVVLDAPQGWQYSLDSIRMQGFLSLEPFVLAELGVDYFFEGQGKTGRLVKTFQDFEGEYQFLEFGSWTDAVWSDCAKERAVNLNIKLRTSKASTEMNSQARGFGFVDSLTDVGLRWRRCR